MTLIVKYLTYFNENGVKFKYLFRGALNNNR
jgi:hypothetical protein